MLPGQGEEQEEGGMARTISREDRGGRPGEAGPGSHLVSGKYQAPYMGYGTL